MARVRHGLILDEITDEIREGDHDLVVGTRPVDGRMRFLLDDVGL